MNIETYRYHIDRYSTFIYILPYITRYNPQYLSRSPQFPWIQGSERPILAKAHAESARFRASKLDRCWEHCAWAETDGRFSRICRTEKEENHVQLVGLKEKLQENPIFHGKIYGFL